jgi:hypothetical protein
MMGRIRCLQNFFSLIRSISAKEILTSAKGPHTHPRKRKQ